MKERKGERKKPDLFELARGRVATVATDERVASQQHSEDPLALSMVEGHTISDNSVHAVQPGSPQGSTSLS